jgi:hypothetical protein
MCVLPPLTRRRRQSNKLEWADDKHFLLEQNKIIFAPSVRSQKLRAHQFWQQLPTHISSTHLAIVERRARHQHYTTFAASSPAPFVYYGPTRECSKILISF